MTHSLESIVSHRLIPIFPPQSFTLLHNPPTTFIQRTTILHYIYIGSPRVCTCCHWIGLPPFGSVPSHDTRARDRFDRAYPVKWLFQQIYYDFMGAIAVLSRIEELIINLSCLVLLSVCLASNPASETTTLKTPWEMYRFIISGCL